jgi:CDP-diglyceride synthetase
VITFVAWFFGCCIILGLILGAYSILGTIFESLQRRSRATKK